MRYSNSNKSNNSEIYKELNNMTMQQRMDLCNAIISIEAKIHANSLLKDKIRNDPSFDQKLINTEKIIQEEINKASNFIYIGMYQDLKDEVSKAQNRSEDLKKDIQKKTKAIGIELDKDSINNIINKYVHSKYNCDIDSLIENVVEESKKENGKHQEAELEM